MRWKYVWAMACVFACGTVVGLLAQPPQRPANPATKWIADVNDAMRKFTIDTQVVDARRKIELEMARWEWFISSTHASHELARATWIAAQRFNRDAQDPQARGLFAQAIGMAHSQYMQAIGMAYQTWLHQESQAFQHTQQGLNASWGTLQVDLNQIHQRAQTALQQLQEAPEPVTFTQLIDVAFPKVGAPDTAYHKAIQAAGNEFVKRLEQITATWRKEVTAIAHPDADLDEANKALRKANRKWLMLISDALDDYRRACRSALRKYQFERVEE